MGNTLLGCVRVGPRKLENNFMNHLYTRPPRSSVRGHSAYTYLDSEREIDPGEEPTLRVSEYLACRTLRTLVNTWYDTPSFWFHLDVPEPLCG